MGLNMINVIMSNEGLAGSNMESVTIETNETQVILCIT